MSNVHVSEVTVGAEMTINTGNYENIKPSVSMTLKIDGPTTVAERKKIMEKAFEELAAELGEQRDSILK